MAKPTSILLLLLMCLLATAQQPLFNEVYEDYRANSGVSIITGAEGYTVFGEGWAQQHGGYVSVKMLRVDEFGYHLWTSIIGQEYFPHTSGLTASSFRINNGLGYINVGAVCDTANSCKGAIRKFNLNGNMEWEKSYGNGFRSSFQHGIGLESGDIIAVGFSQSTLSNPAQAWLARFDSIGNIKWQKAYGGSGNEEYRRVLQTPDGGFLLTGITSSYGSGSSDVWLVKVDSVGNEEWNKTFGDMWTDYYPCITSSADGGYYIAWYAQDDEMGPGLHPTYEKKTYLMKLTNVGNVSWSKVIHQDFLNWAYVFQIKQLSTSDQLILSGSKFSPTSDYLYGWLIKLDSNGEKVWERFYTNDQNPGADNFIYDFQLIEDDGIACTGMGHTPDTLFASKADFWLLVLDSMGCLEPGCDTITGIGEITPAKPLGASIYPNPTSNSITVTVPQVDVKSGYSFTMTNLLGQEVFNSPIIDSKTAFNLDLPSGIYIYQITHQGQVQTGKLVLE